MIAIVATVRQQIGAVRQVLCDAQSLSDDREFLVRMTGDTRTSPIAFARLRRVPQRSVRRSGPRPLWPDHLRAA
ncbi:hypothetical protein [Novosphingobium cyanobacteriorum]|uniref:hypothetical protein n=1 Tax=Novosphingobium cyanobacteriorum TaxID=3024215 RepID=UPI0023F82B78|nr:hypothetical protein [Novosphingobium cyanobacteriorum]